MIRVRLAAGVNIQGFRRGEQRYVDDSDPFIAGLILGGHLVPLEQPKPKAKRSRKAA